MNIFNGKTWEPANSAGSKWTQQVEFDKYWGILATTLEGGNDGTLSSLTNCLDEAFEEFVFLTDNTNIQDPLFQVGIDEALVRLGNRLERVKKKLKEGWDGETWEIISELEALWVNAALGQQPAEIQFFARMVNEYSIKSLFLLTPNILGLTSKDNFGEVTSHLSFVDDLRECTDQLDLAIECLNYMETPRWHMDTSLCSPGVHLANTTCIDLSASVDWHDRVDFHQTLSRLAPKREFTQADIDSLLNDEDLLS